MQIPVYSLYRVYRQNHISSQLYPTRQTVNTTISGSGTYQTYIGSGDTPDIYRVRGHTRHIQGQGTHQTYCQIIKQTKYQQSYVINLTIVSSLTYCYVLYLYFTHNFPYLVYAQAALNRTVSSPCTKTSGKIKSRLKVYKIQNPSNLI